MKYLRHFDTQQEAVDFLDNFDGNYTVIATLEGESRPLFVEGSGDLNITLNFYSVYGTLTVERFENPDEQYTVAYDAETTINIILQQLGINCNLWGGFAEYETEGGEVHLTNPVDMWSTLSSSGILPGSTVYFLPNVQ